MEAPENSGKEVPPLAPTVFISYSHDNPEHKMWVAGLATDLHKHGVDAILDQWHLRPGMDVPLFMEQGIRNANRVCMVCSPEYARKADAGKGGVGYEKMIVTVELYRDLGQAKFIPLVVNGDDAAARPTFLHSRLFIDFRDAAKYEEKLIELLKEAHNVPPGIPPLGRNPFSKPQSTESHVMNNATGATGVAAAPIELPKANEQSPERAYELAQQLLRRSDWVGWKQMVKQLRGTIEKCLLAWFEGISEKRREDEKCVPSVDGAIEAAMPLMAVALAGVESGLTESSDQRSIIDDLLSLSKWPSGGMTIIVELPQTLVYIYQHIHGALCLHTGQPKVALRLAAMTVRDSSSSTYIPLWKHRGMTGWPASLGGEATKGWKYLVSLPAKFPWLREMFVREGDWEVSLNAYNLLLSALDLANTIKDGQSLKDKGRQVYCDVPPMFMLARGNAVDRAFLLAFRDAAATATIAEGGGVTPAKLRAEWWTWVTIALGFGEPTFTMRRYPFHDLP